MSEITPSALTVVGLDLERVVGISSILIVAVSRSASAIVVGNTLEELKVIFSFSLPQVRAEIVAVLEVFDVRSVVSINVNVCENFKAGLMNQEWRMKRKKKWRHLPQIRMVWLRVKLCWSTELKPLKTLKLGLSNLAVLVPLSH